MSPGMGSTTGAHVERRLAAIRGGAQPRSPTVRALAAYAQHADCALATLGFSAGVNFDVLLAKTRFQAPFGQSPFAFARDLAFEKLLRKAHYAATLDVLRPVLKFPRDVRIENLRDSFTPTRDGMSRRATATRTLLQRIIGKDPAAPHLIDGAVLAASIGGVLAHFEADALAALFTSAIRVAEVKSFPKVDERVDPDKLGAALDQVAIYILLVREEVLRLGGDPERLVSDRALLITPKNVGMQPTLSEHRVVPRLARIKKVLDDVPRVADVAASVPEGLSFGPIADVTAVEERRLDALRLVADSVGTTYKPTCLTTCGNARFCRERTFRASSPCLLGTTTLRLMPGVRSLDRAAELTSGATATPEEAAAAALLERAGRLYDATTRMATSP